MGKTLTQKVTLTCEGITADGRAVARLNGQVIFVERGVPGDTAEVNLIRKEKGIPIGRIETLVFPSEERRTPRCEHFGVCGGCKWQMMSYEAQLKYKHQHVLDVFDRIAKVKVRQIFPIIGAEDEYFYRNKLEFTFSSSRWLTREEIATGEKFDQRALGFHAPKTFDKVINIETCHLQSPFVNEIRNEIGRFVREHNIPFYNIRTNKGFLRNLVFRSSLRTGEHMMILIVAEDKPEWVNKIFRHIELQFPQLVEMVWIVNSKLNSSYSDLPFRIWKGWGYINEWLEGYQFQVGPISFFQTHTKQAERLYQVVKEMVRQVLAIDTTQHPLVYDLYCGTGSIGIFISELAEKIVGIEYVEASIQDAQRNVELNKLNNFSFYAGDMRKVLTEELVQKEGKPRVIIVDPPRAGMDPKVVKRLLHVAAPYVIYVSCKPATQARDIALMTPDYEVLEIQPVDMFPQTTHVENVALLRHKSYSN